MFPRTNHLHFYSEYPLIQNTPLFVRAHTLLLTFGEYPPCGCPEIWTYECNYQSSVNVQNLGKKTNKMLFWEQNAPKARFFWILGVVVKGKELDFGDVIMSAV